MLICVLLWTRIRRTEVSLSHSHRTAGGRTEDRQKRDRRQTGEDETKHNRREDTRGHRPRQRTWKRRDDRGDMTGQWWWWWDNRGQQRTGTRQRGETRGQRRRHDEDETRRSTLPDEDNNKLETQNKKWHSGRHKTAVGQHEDRQETNGRHETKARDDCEDGTTRTITQDEQGHFKN